MNGDRLATRVRIFSIAKSGAAAGTLALALIFPAVRHASAQDPGNPLHTASRTELDVVKVVLAQEKAWNNGDIESWAQEFKNSPDTLCIGRDISRGYAHILDDYKHNYTTRASMGTISYSELEAHTLSDTFAVCLGKYHLDRSKKEGGPADGMFSLVLEKTDQGWKIVLDHST